MLYIYVHVLHQESRLALYVSNLELCFGDVWNISTLTTVKKNIFFLVSIFKIVLKNILSKF